MRELNGRSVKRNVATIKKRVKKAENLWEKLN